MPASAPIARRRLDAIDTLRGLVMILMALDHVRDFFGTPGISPTNLAQTTVALFATRWITHFCAPVFFLLTGVGACLARRHKSTGELSRFLLVRGLWLIVLELTILRCFGYQFNMDYRVTLLVILWALGWSMIALAALIWLRVPLIAAIALAMIAGHNLFDTVQSANPLWVILHRQFFVANGWHVTVGRWSWSAPVLFVAYPLIPWIGVTAAGFSLGRIYQWPAPKRQRFLLATGLTLTAAFIVLRATNLYGDPVHWTRQTSAAMTGVSFLNANKYPPSLIFLLMTLGPALLALRWLDARTPRWLAPALTLGRVPLFYFILHLPLIHLLAVIACALKYGAVHWMFESPDLANYPFTPPPGWGFSLPVIYAIWVAVVALLYPICRWFAGVKQRRTDWWLGYL